MKNGDLFQGGPWCFANGTTLTNASFRKRFQVQYHLSEIFAEVSLQMVSAFGVYDARKLLSLVNSVL